MNKITVILHICALPRLAEVLRDSPDPQIHVKSGLYGESWQAQDIIDPDILHLHGLAVLTDENLLGLVRARHKAGRPVIVSLFKEGFLPGGSEPEKIINQCRDVLEKSSAIFLEDCSLRPHVQNMENWSWNGTPLRCGRENLQDAEYEGKSKFKILYVAEPGREQQLEHLKNAVASVKSEGIDLELTLAGQNTENETAIRELIEECDIFLGGDGVSYLALTALSFGKTALATVPGADLNFAGHFEMSPILSIDDKNLTYRLKALAKQPKSLRDFGRRGLEYIKAFHSPEQINQNYLEIYRQLL